MIVTAGRGNTLLYFDDKFYPRSIIQKIFRQIVDYYYICGFHEFIWKCGVITIK
jgi:hypothetical protein